MDAWGSSDRRDDLDVADQLFATAQRPGRLGPGHSRLRSQHRQQRIGDADGAPERHARASPTQQGKGGVDPGLHPGVESGHVANAPLMHGVGEIGDGDGAQPLVERGELGKRDRARLEEPPQIRGKVGNRRFEQHPAARLVHRSQARVDLGVRLGVGRLEQGPQVGVGGDVARADELACTDEGSGLGSVAADAGNQRQLVERAGEWRRRVGGNRLAFQRAGFRRSLTARLLGFGR